VALLFRSVWLYAIACPLSVAVSEGCFHHMLRKCRSCSSSRSGRSSPGSSFGESPSFSRPWSDAILIGGDRFGRKHNRILDDRNHHRDICACTSGEAKHRFRYQSCRLVTVIELTRRDSSCLHKIHVAALQNIETFSSPWVQP
jgi:hypothetical protein